MTLTDELHRSVPPALAEARERVDQLLRHVDDARRELLADAPTDSAVTAQAVAYTVGRYGLPLNERERVARLYAIREHG